MDDARAARGGSDLALVTAEYELRRAVGVVHEGLILAGSLQGTVPPLDLGVLMELALDRRLDLRAKQAAIAEAEARWRLENSNRYGNPTLGPSYGYDTSRISSAGVTLLVPLPILNRKQGDILQRQAEQARAALEFRQVGVLVQQDVQSAVARVQRAQAWVDTYEKQVLPNLRKSLEAVEKLFDVKVIGEAFGGAVANGTSAAKPKPKRRERTGGGAGGAADGKLVSPIQGTVLKVNVNKGDQVWITNVPGYGLHIHLVGKKQEFIPGVKFSKAVWEIYLGEKNIGEAVKKALVSRLG